MLSTNFTQEMLGLQDVMIKNIKNIENSAVIEIELPRKLHCCPACKKETDRIHDYRRQKVKDLSLFGRDVTLILSKRRYACPCGKRFFEDTPFLPKYQRRTQRTSIAMLERLTELQSYTAVGREFSTSAGSVIRLFNNISFPKPKKLPEVLGIDEFKGNTGKQKFHCILTDIQSGKIVDILHTRYEHELCSYFKGFDRSDVKYFVSDMYTPYSEIAKTYFPKAEYVIDKYHWIRQTTWAMEAVRKEVQKQFSREHRVYFKHSRTLLLKRREKLKPEQWQQVSNMLYVSPTLSTAYFLKEQLYNILDMDDHEAQEKRLSEWIIEASESEIPAFIKVSKTYARWFKPIVNSLHCSYTNGFTEGCNNKIKVLKRVSYGCRDFRRFRNRILYIFSNMKEA